MSLTRRRRAFCAIQSRDLLQLKLPQFWDGTTNNALDLKRADSARTIAHYALQPSPRTLHVFQLGCRAFPCWGRSRARGWEEARLRRGKLLRAPLIIVFGVGETWRRPGIGSPPRRDGYFHKQLPMRERASSHPKTLGNSRLFTLIPEYSGIRVCRRKGTAARIITRRGEN